ncbi:hypothetical protein [Pseudorhodoferax sp. Leaf274]|uniref:hypothetical protein n=1 Tax=Pseudorhodoferax sp. Leaf274 TaxID=1736318 RepID=UPI0009E76890|nr:hypothetical protein [Pseudorhodoferax sp. Leaf274]
MAERPILFSAPMVRALMASTKTQTRRVCKPAQAAALSHVVEVPDPAERGQVYNGSTFGDEEGEAQFACPYGGRGDRLWVRETFGRPWHHAQPRFFYRATDDEKVGWHPDFDGWTPSIHMPRAACRLVLEVTEVRVERLQDISRGDAMAEGCPFQNMAQGPDPRQWYAELWDQINGAGSWAANPWVWAVSFKAVPSPAEEQRNG